MGERLAVHPVTRIEGHAKIVLDVDDSGDVQSGHLQVLEIRGFEKLLQKTELFKMPQVTARLCGVCPAAHHLAAVTAIEQGLGVEPPGDAKRLRELLYVGHILHSHALSTFVLTGPDIICGIDAKPGERNVFSLLKLNAELVKKVLRLRSIGQWIVEAVGGRGVHPVTAVPGGMAGKPDKEKLEQIAAWGTEALELLEELTGTIRGPLQQVEGLRRASELDYHSLALTSGGAHSFLEGDWAVMDHEGGRERTFTGADYGDHLIEHVMPGSYMKSVRLRGDAEKTFFVGPLARLNVNDTISTPRAAELLEEFHGAGRPRRSAVDFIEARLLEMVHCAERAAAIPGQLEGGEIRRSLAPPGEGRFIGAIEAPRGILVHDYTTDDDGRIETVNFIVATQNNYDAIDSTIGAFARLLKPKADDNLLMNGIEFALRCFDPCLACATHCAGQMPMEVVIQRNGIVLRRLERRVE